MSEEFSMHMFEGVFGTMQVDEEIQHWVKTGAGEELRIDAAFTALVGRTVQVAAHHLPHPPTPKDPKQWVNIVATGQLGHDPKRGVYTVQKFDGSKQELDLMVFCGCSARVLLATADAVERARDVVVAGGSADMVEGLGRDAKSLRELLSDLTKIAGDLKK